MNVRAAATWLVVALGAAGGVACTAPPPDPQPVRVEPASGFNGETTRVRVVGTGFYPILDLSAVNGSAGSFEEGFVVRLWPADAPTAPGTTLSGITLESLNVISGDVREGLDPGVYDVEVQTPTGQSGRTPALFTVTDTKVDRIDLSADATDLTVGVPTLLRVSLADVDGGRVQEDLEVTLRFATSGLTDLTFNHQGFSRVRTLDAPDVGLVGDLGDDGEAVINLNAGAAGQVVATASAASGSGIGGDSVLVSWASGTNLRVAFTLPEPDFVTVAGEAFDVGVAIVDDDDRVATDVSRTLLVSDACGGWFAQVPVVRGEATVSVRPVRASGTSTCVQNRLQVLASDLSGASDLFQVEPGPVDEFDVVLDRVLAVAGQPVRAVLTPLDAWGNRTTWTGDIVSLSDGVEIFDADACGVPSTLVCDLVPERSGTQRNLEVVDALGVRGRSQRYDVVAGPPSVLVLTVDPEAWTAGEARGITLDVTDALGNAIPGVSVDRASLSVEDPRGEVVCVPVGAQAVPPLSCTLRTATDATRLTVTTDVSVGGVVTSDLSGATADFAVHNGPIAQASLTPSSLDVLAGQRFTVAIVATDAFGNPYVHQASSVLGLTDTSQTLRPEFVTLGPDGTTTAGVTITQAGVTQITALAGNDPVGITEPIAILAGTAVRFDVHVDAPWVWVGEPASITVEAVDAYGNRAVRDAAVNVRSDSTLLSASSIAVVNGVGSGTGVWGWWTLQDRVLVESTGGSGLTGASAPVLVVRRCLEEPTPVLRLDGGDVGRACYDPAAGEASFVADLSASQPAPGAALAAFAVAHDTQSAQSDQPMVTGTVPDVGVFPVYGLAVDDDGCAAEDAGVVWAGPDDGSAVGPLTLTPAVDRLAITSPVGGVDVTISDGLTCRNTVAAGAPIFVRTSRGTLTTQTAPTGIGLATLLGPGGSSTIRLDVTTTDNGGTARLAAWSAPLSAWGTAQVNLTGDRRLPVVWSQSPKGALLLSTDTLRVTFSERMDLTTFTTSSVTLSGPSSRTWTSSQSTDGRTITFTLDAPIGPTSPGWALFLGPAITDLSGNPLAGAWSGVGSAYEGVMASGLPIDPLTSCTVDPVVFRPDGDAGAGIEADRTTLSWVGTSTPAWWVVDVYDAEGTFLVRRQVAPRGPSQSWIWDGRDVTGEVVPAGTYTLDVRAEDASGNRGTACSRQVSVELATVEVP